MTSNKQSCIHTIRDLQFEVVDLDETYDIVRAIGEGDYGKVILARHRPTRTEVALKGVPKSTTAFRDFLTEFHYSYFLSPHHNILDTYDVSFETNDYYYFAQEVAPHGDLLQAIEENGGMEENDLKVVVKQICSALEFMHSKELVHRDMRAENVLVFKPDFTRVKLTDFGLTRRSGTLVRKRTRSLPTCPPEIWEAVHLEGYHVEVGSDVWQMAMMIFIALSCKFPWDKADITDNRFTEFIQWQKRKSTRIPKDFKKFSQRLLRMFRRMMDPKPSKRYPITEVNKYLNDRWLILRIQRKPQKMEYPSLDAPKEPEENQDMKVKDVKEHRVQEWILSSNS